MNPFTAAAFAWQTAFVFTLRSAQLWAEPAEAQARLTGYVLEKQKAFTTGAFAAGQAVLSGAGAEAVMAAAIAPSHRRVRANLRKIIRG